MPCVPILPPLGEIRAAGFFWVTSHRCQRSALDGLVYGRPLPTGGNSASSAVNSRSHQ
jgi:hypothetical protein